MLSDSYNVEFETGAIRSDEPTLLREDNVPRDEGWSWVILLAAFLTLFVTNGVHTSFGILYAALLSHFGSGREETAWIGSISLGLLCFFSPIASLLIEHIGCRATSAIGGFICSLGLFFSSFATGIALLYFTHGVLFGFGTSLTYTAAMTVVARSFERKRNLATGLCASGSQFGGISLAPLSQVLFDRLGYANTFRTLSGLLLIVAISSLAYKPEFVKNQTLASARKKSPKEMLVVWKNKAYVIWALSTTMVALGYNVPRYTLVKYAIDLNISKDASAWLLSYMCASSAIGRILFGRVCEWVPKLYLCQACVVGCALGAFIFPFLKTYLALAIACFIFGVPDGGFVASLPMLTTEIVGQERMVEGFGFLLFCQSYSNVIGPPLSGMLYDTYQSYKAAFCFAAIPEIIGVVMMFVIPFYTQNQVNYRREIDLSSNSGIIIEDNINVTTSPSPLPESTIQHEPIGNYNIIINIPAPSTPDIKQVNLTLKRIPPETNYVETANYNGEISSNNNQVVDQMESAETTLDNICHATKYTENTVSNTTIVASDYISTVKDENTENIQPTSGIGQEAIGMQLNQLSRDGFAGVSLTTGNKICEVVTNTMNILDPDTTSAEPVSLNNILTITSHELVEEPIKSQKDYTKEPDEFLNKDIASLIPQIKASDKSISLENSSNSIKIPSSVALLPGATVEYDTNYTGESSIPGLTLLPQANGPSMGVLGDVKDVEFTAQINESYHDDAIVPLITTTTTGNFSPSLGPFVHDNNSCSQDLAFANEVAMSSGLNTEVTENRTASSFMVSTGITGTFPLVHNQLPEPLKPTSVCSVVRGNTMHAPNNCTEVSSGNLEKISDSSPLSSELSTVIADVIQSLTSQHTGTQKSNRESTATGVANDNASSQSKVHAQKHASSEMCKMNGNSDNKKLGCCKESIGSVHCSPNDGSSGSKMQTSVLDSMQSIVAEGYPEDIALLEDISIDLSLDKDPSITSIILHDDQDIHFEQLSFAGHHNPKTGQLSSKISLTCPSQSNIPFPTITEDTFSRNNPTLNVFPEANDTQQNIHSSTATVTEATKALDYTNPFFSKTA